MDSEIIGGESSLKLRPPSRFTGSREFVEIECARERALDLEVQRVMENDSGIQKVERPSSMLAR